jgi:hypothetical protein
VDYHVLQASEKYPYFAYSRSWDALFFVSLHRRVEMSNWRPFASALSLLACSLTFSADERIMGSTLLAGGYCSKIEWCYSIVLAKPTLLLRW